MDIDGLLDAHLQQRPDGHAVIDELKSLRVKVDATVDERYERDKTKALTADIHTHTAQAVFEAWRALDAEAATAHAEDLDIHDDDARERASTNGHAAIDPSRFTSAVSAAEVSVLLNDALVIGDATARAAWAYAEPKLRQMAAREMREHKQPGATSAFNALVTWQGKMTNLSRRTPDRTALVDASRRRRRELKEWVLSACRVVALDVQVARLIRAADVGERTPQNTVPPKSTMVMGRWFDQFGPTRK